MHRNRNRDPARRRLAGIPFVGGIALRALVINPVLMINGNHRDRHLPGLHGMRRFLYAVRRIRRRDWFWPIQQCLRTNEEATVFFASVCFC